MLDFLSVLFLIISAICVLVILIDVMFHKQRMAIMNIVWPLTALYGGVFALMAYYTIGRKGALHANNLKMKKPFWQSVVVSTLHCGSGCTLGDIIAESLLIIFPFSILGNKTFDSWIMDFIFAFLIGIAFQYFSIKPMKHLTSKQALIEAVKADTLSLIAWQAGMYGFMAIVLFCIYKHPLPKTGIIFWYSMQLAMLTGFCTSYPVNWLLLKKGIKAEM